MRVSESWARGMMNQNVVVRVSNMNVMSRFGNTAPPKTKERTKPKDSEKFVVGETEVGGEEVV